MTFTKQAAEVQDVALVTAAAAAAEHHGRVAVDYDEYKVRHIEFGVCIVLRQISAWLI